LPSADREPIFNQGLEQRMSARLERSQIDWAVSSFLVGYHVLLLVGLPIYFAQRTPSVPLVAISLVLLLLTEIGIGAGYHRFYSHRCYGLNRAVEAVFLFLATLATQGSALRWSHNHRIHHAHVDTDADPYAITKGFWHAHCLWLFRSLGELDPKWVPDLMKNRLVMFQHPGPVR
jgi:stearoyl-CoA desaturase (delta-9 desaturase)